MLQRFYKDCILNPKCNCMGSGEQLLKDIELYIRRLFEVHYNPNLYYHNLNHTLSVVKSTDLIAEHYKLNEEDLLSLRTAAWFHDAGYLFEAPPLHEESSSLLAENYLKEKNINASIIHKVKGCIMATKLPQSPKSLIEQIICDADLFNLGTDKFKETGKMMRKETEAILDEKIKGRQWREKNIAFLGSHNYFTTFAKTMLDETKAGHLKELLEKAEEKNLAKEARENEIVQLQEEPVAEEAMTKALPAEKKEKKKKKEVAVRMERGVETMFRVTYSNHSQISSMADSKANILISVTSISISVVLSFFIQRMDEFPYLIVPTLIFIISCLAALTMAILCTRPNLTPATNSTDVEQKRKRNLLFFGNFYYMSLEEYEREMDEMLKESGEVYANLTRNLYFLGIVLKRKYKLLHYAYSTFMYGVIISVVVFIIAASANSESITKLFK